MIDRIVKAAIDHRAMMMVATLIIVALGLWSFTHLLSTANFFDGRIGSGGQLR